MSWELFWALDFAQPHQTRAHPELDGYEMQCCFFRVLKCHFPLFPPSHCSITCFEACCFNYGKEGQSSPFAAMPVAPIEGDGWFVLGSAAARRHVEQCWLVPEQVGEVGGLFASHHISSGYSYGAGCCSPSSATPSCVLNTVCCFFRAAVNILEPILR